jgi:hypothetical protein
MSDLPPNIDAILSSIRSRMSEDAGIPAEPAPPPPVVLATPDVPLEALGSMDVSGPGNGTGTTAGLTLDGLVRSMLEPMLKAWLDANMPEIVEKLAQSEIRRLTGRD